MTAKQSAESFIKGGRIPHAILLECDGGEVCDYIAKAAVCSGDNRPCGTCRECHLAEVGSHPDISYVTPDEGKKNITVDKIRALRAEAFVKPHSAQNRVFVIEGADRMNEQAQNALLKVLEEPPAGVIFILICASRTALLETIVSRCSVITADADNSISSTKSEAKDAAEKFLQQLFSGNELEMLYTLRPFEKDRVLADEFFAALKLCIARQLRRSYNQKNRSRVLTALYSNITKYEGLLKTNINLPLLFSTAVCETKQLI